MFKVLVPNLRVAIISASFLTAAIVIGEYTLADTLLIETLAPFQQKFVGREPQAGYALNLLALLVTTLLFAADQRAHPQAQSEAQDLRVRRGAVRNRHSHA